MPTQKKITDASPPACSGKLDQVPLVKLEPGKRTSLFLGQWADVPLPAMLQKARSFGYNGVELSCWGGQFEVRKANRAYCDSRRALLKKYGLFCHAISTHLVGQGVCDLIDERHQKILPEHVYGDGKPEGVRQRAAEELMITGTAAKQFGVNVVNGFTGSSIWHLCYSFPPVLPGQIDAGYKDFAKRFMPVLDHYEKLGIRYALEVHPTEIAFDIASAERALQAVDYHPAFGFNYDPSHFGYQGVDYVAFIRRFHDRIFHVHMKDVAWNLGNEAGVFGGHVDFHKPNRYWDFKSMGRGCINFEKIIRALNDIGYTGPLSVEWEDGGMDREHGARESCEYVNRLDFAPSAIVFDGQFDR